MVDRILRITVISILERQWSDSWQSSLTRWSTSKVIFFSCVYNGHQDPLYLLDFIPEYLLPSTQEKLKMLMREKLSESEESGYIYVLRVYGGSLFSFTQVIDALSNEDTLQTLQIHARM